MKILVTGSTGFVGSRLVNTLEAHGIECVKAVRNQVLSDQAENVLVGDVAEEINWRSVLKGVQAVVHLAARVHVMRETSGDALFEFRRVNLEGTLRLARQAAESGVRRFVFLSSVKVNGESTPAGKPFTADQDPAPSDPYGISKCEAEAELKLLAEASGMEVVVIRPPLVYGPGVKANFSAMLAWLYRGLPLPLGRVIDNRRSLVFIDNLVDLIRVCIDHPAAANQVFLVSDDEDLSTAELLRRSAAALGKPARLLSLPVSLITNSAKILGRPGVAQRLCDSLQVDISKTKRLLNWVPPVSVGQGLKITAERWISQKKSSLG